MKNLLLTSALLLGSFSLYADETNTQCTKKCENSTESKVCIEECKNSVADCISSQKLEANKKEDVSSCVANFEAPGIEFSSSETESSIVEVE